MRQSVLARHSDPEQRIQAREGRSDEQDVGQQATTLDKRGPAFDTMAATSKWCSKTSGAQRAERSNAREELGAVVDERGRPVLAQRPQPARILLASTNNRLRSAPSDPTAPRAIASVVSGVDESGGERVDGGLSSHGASWTAGAGSPSVVHKSQ